MKINLTKNEILNLIVDLKVYMALCSFNNIKLNNVRTKRNKQIIKKLRGYYLK